MVHSQLVRVKTKIKIITIIKYAPSPDSRAPLAPRCKPDYDTSNIPFQIGISGAVSRPRTVAQCRPPLEGVGGPVSLDQTAAMQNGAGFVITLRSSMCVNPAEFIIAAKSTAYNVEHVPNLHCHPLPYSGKYFNTIEVIAG